MPDFSLEERCPSPVAGVDEVGRGPLAGPVIAAAAVIPEELREAVSALGVDDSKRLSRARREAIGDRLAELVPHAVGRASVTEIDGMNILRASLLAMKRAVEGLPLVPGGALVDGIHAPALSCPVVTVKGGDGKSVSIAAASILAKVARDREMAGLDLEWPGYGWARNAGYGTRAHIEAIGRLGVTPEHRRSFAPVARRLREERDGGGGPGAPFSSRQRPPSD